MPRGAWASMVLGGTAAAAAWAMVGFWPEMRIPGTESVRPDQLTMWLLGALVGSVVLGGRALRQSRSVVLDGLLGFAAGGAAALLGATLCGQMPSVNSSVGFIVVRTVGWGCCAALTSLSLALCIQHRDRRMLWESMRIAAVGGVIAGSTFSLPGPSELWQAIAFLVHGGAIGLATVWPLYRCAVAVADKSPRRGPVPGIIGLREWPLYEGGAVALGSATLACQGGKVALYPSTTGVVWNGRAVIAPLYLTGGGTVLVAEQRFRVELLVAQG